MMPTNDEFETAEEDLNDNLGRLEQLVEDTAGATHALSCGVPDRDSNEVRYLEKRSIWSRISRGEVLAGTWQKSPWWSVKDKFTC